MRKHETMDKQEQDNILIDTPYGKKRWGFLRRILDTHEELVAAAGELIDRMDIVRFRGWLGHPLMNRCRQAIDKARENSDVS